MSISRIFSGSSNAGTSDLDVRSINVRDDHQVSDITCNTISISTGASFGMTGTRLSYYEEDDTTMASNAFNGSVSGSLASAGRITRVGNMVCIKMAVINGACSGILTSTIAVPSRFRPTSTITYVIATHNDGTASVGSATIQSTDGLIKYHSDFDATGFTNAAIVGNTTFSYII